MSCVVEGSQVVSALESSPFIASCLGFKFVFGGGVGVYLLCW